MKIEELMVGDWIIHPYFNYPAKIQYFIGSKARIEFEVAEAETIKPIPLTPEILEKNGWHQTKDSTYCLRAETTLWYEFNGNKLCFIGGSKLKIEYVHQLQHAMKLCSIEKEITI